MKDNAGKITSATAQLFCFSTKQEHLDPQHSFDAHPEPVYPNQESNLKHHGEHCWKVALLNAYRILDLFNEESIQFPYDWIPIQCSAKSYNYSSLVASAAFLMGLHYAKALALQKAKVVIKGEKMNAPNKDNYKALGKILYPACEVLDKKLGRLPDSGGSKVLLDYLVANGKASKDQGLTVVFTEEGAESVGSKKLLSYIDRYRERQSPD